MSTAPEPEPEPQPVAVAPAEIESSWPHSDDIDQLLASDSDSDDDDDQLLLLGPVLYQLRHAGLPPEFVNQAHRMPVVVRALLVEGADPSSVTPSDVLDSLQLRGHERAAAAAEAKRDLAIAMLCQPHALTAECCEKLRNAVDAGLQNGDQCRGRDSVDHATEFQLNLTVSELAAIIGQNSVTSLRRVAENFLESAWKEATQIFVRRYSGDTRPWIPFHRDQVPKQQNLAINYSHYTRGTCKKA